jgi:transcriptional regulator of acetoin/glycerol metabolism
MRRMGDPKEPVERSDDAVVPKERKPRADLTFDSIRDALVATAGYVSRAAKELHVTRSWLHVKLAAFPKLAEFAKKLRENRGPRTGRPRNDPYPSPAAIRKAWTTHKGSAHAVALALKIPRTSLRRTARALGLTPGKVE